MNYLVNVQQNQARLSSRIAELREEIKLRIANKASADVTFDKVIECFAELTILAKETNLAHRNPTDPSWRIKRNAALDVVLDLVDAVEPAKPLRAQMVTQARAWLSEFNDYKLWRDVMVYCYMERFRSDLVRSYPNRIEFSDEHLKSFADQNPDVISNAYLYDISPQDGRRLEYPLAQVGAWDHWNYMQKMLRLTTSETDVTSQPEQLSDDGLTQ